MDSMLITVMDSMLIKFMDSMLIKVGALLMLIWISC